MDREEAHEIAAKILRSEPEKWIEKIEFALEKAYLKGRLDGQEALAKAFSESLKRGPQTEGEIAGFRCSLGKAIQGKPVNNKFLKTQ